MEYIYYGIPWNSKNMFSYNVIRVLLYLVLCRIEMYIVYEN